MLDLPSDIECQSCWIGKHSDSLIVVKNSGGHSGFWLTNDKAVNLDKLKTDFDHPEEFQAGAFTIFPDRFFLHKGESITLSVKFNPENEGAYSQDIKLACDNMKIYNYSLNAEANMIQLLVTHIDDNSLLEDKNKKLDMIYFVDNDHGTIQTRSLLIQNLTKNMIDYSFVFQGENNSNFEVSPQTGTFLKSEHKKFDISFNAIDPVAQYKKLDLVIKNIPIKSVRDPPPHLQKMIEKLENDRLRGKIRDDNERVEFVYFTFDIVGQVRTPLYEITPPLIYFPFPVELNQPQTSVFTLQNKSSVPTVFRIEKISQSSPHISSFVNQVFRVNEDGDKISVSPGNRQGIDEDPQKRGKIEK